MDKNMVSFMCVLYRNFVSLIVLRRGAKILLIAGFALCCFAGRAQLLTNLGDYRNQVFVNTGYYNSFANYSLGWFHNEHLKFIKRDVSSILDFSFPISQTSFTRFVFRKGLQMNVWQDSTWRLPIAIIGSSDKIITSLFRVHNFVTDVFFCPGIYRRRYTLAIDLDYKVIWFSHYKKTGDVPVPGATPEHPHSKIAAGIAAGLNYSRVTYLIRAGYQQTADIAKDPYQFFAIFQLGYNCNFKKRK